MGKSGLKVRIGSEEIEETEEAIDSVNISDKPLKKASEKTTEKTKENQTEKATEKSMKRSDFSVREVYVLNVTGDTGCKRETNDFCGSP